MSANRHHQAMLRAWSHQRELMRFLQRRIGRREDVADLAQETYVRLLRFEADEVREPLALLYQIASWVVGDFRKQALRDARVTIDSEAADDRIEQPDDCGDELAHRIDRDLQLQRALAVLPSTHMAVLLLHKRDGLSYAEVATKLNLSEHTVKKYMTDAYAKIRSMAREELNP